MVVVVILQGINGGGGDSDGKTLVMLMVMHRTIENI